MLLVWGAYNTADGEVDRDLNFCMGMGTYRGGTPDHAYLCTFSDDGIGTSDVSRGSNTTALMKGHSASPTPTIDFEVALVSLNAGTPSTIVINWIDLPGTASLIFHYLVLGGDEITDAFVGSFSHSSANPQDVTVAAGFGKPDLVIFLSTTPGTPLRDVAGSSRAPFCLGIAKDDAERQAFVFSEQDAAANMVVGIWQKQRAFINTTGAQAADFETDLAAKVDWPTDGFRMTKVDTPAATDGTLYCVLKGTFTATLGEAETLTSGADLDLAHGHPPKAAFFWGGNVDKKTTIDTSHADLGAMGIGATDGVNEGWAGVNQDDANTTAVTGCAHDATKAWKTYTQGATPVQASAADASFVGNAVRLNFGDLDNIARGFNYLILGDAPALPGRTPEGALQMQAVKQAAFY